ncbi:hypothetical protein STEG23_004006 [Scotinomys teguina]
MQAGERVNLASVLCASSCTQIPGSSQAQVTLLFERVSTPAEAGLTTVHTIHTPENTSYYRQQKLLLAISLKIQNQKLGHNLTANGLVIMVDCTVVREDVEGNTVDGMILHLAKTMEAHTLDSHHCEMYLELLQGSGRVG